MPNQENLVFILTVVASIASILSVPIAIAQTIRIRRLNVEKKLKVWTQISSIKAQMRLLEAEKIETSYGLICEQFRDWLREAVLLESDFSAETQPQLEAAPKAPPAGGAQSQKVGGPHRVRMLT